jgi:signal transduction histidine kinase
VARLDETFETMRETITHQEDELRGANASLEQRVAERTRTLQLLVEATQQFSRVEPRLEQILPQLVETARHLAGARYAALGVFDETGERLAQFVTAGMDEATKEAIGDLPSGRGLLGHLAHGEGVLRLKDLTQHPASVGFPPNHPPMRSFLGAPIQVDGRLYGRLYLTDKQGADEFTAQDEQVIAGLAAQTGVAIENAQFVKEIRASREQNRATMASLPVSVVRLGKGLTIRFANRAFYDLVHRRTEDSVGRPIDEVLPVVGIDEFLVTAQAVGKAPLERRVREAECVMAGGEPRVLCLTASGISRADDDDDDDDDIVLVIEDLTERRQAEEALRQSEEQLRQSQKLEAVGQLAGGIAHDFNNLLTAIMSSGELMFAQLSDADALRLHLEEIKIAVHRGSSLTHQLLAFSRRQVLQPTVLELSALVTEMARMLHRLIGDDIELALASGTEQTCVKADRGQLEQVVLNLALNARDAMPGGGRLTIETRGVSLEAPHCLPTLSPGRYACLIVRDTGCGMDATTRARIFEPFFTTKEVGKGTGLGLAMVHGIAEQSGGAITVESAPGLGTTFTVYLPAVTESPLPEAPGVSRAVPHTGSETVLLVEDDDLVRGPLAKALHLAGYAVLVAAGPAEALRLAGERGGVIHLLVTDVVMPQMNGRDLAHRVTGLHPRIKVLYMSGYPNDVLGHPDSVRHRSGRVSDTVDPTIAFLQKPFTLDELARKIREVLDSP